jgi:hypothetical protein
MVPIMIQFNCPVGKDPKSHEVAGLYVAHNQPSLRLPIYTILLIRTLRPDRKVGLKVMPPQL